MEMKVDDAEVVTANRATAPCFFDEQALDLLLASRHGFADTSLAAPSGGTILAG
jgi:hypothetical protein